MAAPEVWFVILAVEPETESGFLEDTSLRVSYTGTGQYRYGWVNADDMTRLEAARWLRGTLASEEQDRVRTGRVGLVTEIEEVLL